MISNTWMVALKLFLPSWNFFNDFAAVPRMEYQLVCAGAEAGEWRPLFTNNGKRSVFRILFNPSGNLELLEKSLIDRAVDELSPDERDKHALVASEARSTLARIAKARINDRYTSATFDQYRFRVILVEPGFPNEVVFASDLLSLERGPA